MPVPPKPSDREDHACAVCVKRHEVPAAVLNEQLGIRAAARLECRALPPIQDVAHHAVFPTVAPDAYCHLHFQVDPEAVKAQRAAAKSTEDLDAKVAETQARAAAQPELALQPGEPMKNAPDVPLPPAGDAPPTQGRARRARGAAKA